MFVFDGGVPVLKRQTLERRQQQRDVQAQRIKVAAEKLLLSRLLVANLSQKVKVGGLSKGKKSQNQNQNQKRRATSKENESEEGSIDVDFHLSAKSSAHRTIRTKLAGSSQSGFSSSEKLEQRPLSGDDEKAGAQEEVAVEDLKKYAKVQSLTKDVVASGKIDQQRLSELDVDTQFQILQTLKVKLQTGATLASLSSNVETAEEEQWSPSVMRKVIGRNREYQFEETISETPNRTQQRERGLDTMKQYSTTQLSSFLKQTKTKKEIQTLEQRLNATAMMQPDHQRIISEKNRYYVLKEIQPEEELAETGEKEAHELKIEVEAVGEGACEVSVEEVTLQPPLPGVSATMLDKPREGHAIEEPKCEVLREMKNTEQSSSERLLEKPRNDENRIVVEEPAAAQDEIPKLDDSLAAAETAGFPDTEGPFKQSDDTSETRKPTEQPALIPSVLKVVVDSDSNVSDTSSSAGLDSDIEWEDQKEGEPEPLATDELVTADTITVNIDQSFDQPRRTEGLDMFDALYQAKRSSVLEPQKLEATPKDSELHTSLEVKEATPSLVSEPILVERGDESPQPPNSLSKETLLKSAKANLEEAESEYRDRMKYDIDLNQSMLLDIKQLLALLGIPFIDAPMEAEAQCASLEEIGLVHGVVTEDSDAFVFGARTVYKNIFSDRKYVQAYEMNEVEQTLGLNRERLILLALFLGSDYTQGIKHIGIVNAMEILRHYPSAAELEELKEWVNQGRVGEIKPPGRRKKKRKTSLETMEQGSRQQETPSQDSSIQEFKRKHSKARQRWVIPDSFPSKVVIDAYQYPSVLKEQTAVNNITWRSVRRKELEDFLRAKLRFDEGKLGLLLDEPLRLWSTRSTQLTLESYRIKYEDKHTFAKIRSRRLQKAVDAMASSEASSEKVEPRTP